jgi:hypothetical protein
MRMSDLALPLSQFDASLVLRPFAVLWKCERPDRMTRDQSRAPRALLGPDRDSGDSSADRALNASDDLGVLIVERHGEPGAAARWVHDTTVTGIDPEEICVLVGTGRAPLQ